MTASAAEKMQALLDSMEDLEVITPHAKIMIYGESGVGKTVEAAMLAQAITPKDKRILYVDAVEGWVSLLNHDGLTNRTSRMKYLGRSQIDSICAAIKAGNETMSKFGTIILDELSTMSKNDLDVVLRSRAAKDAGKDPDVPTQPDYLSNTERMRRTSIELLGLSVNVILVSHLREDKDQRTGVISIKPAFMPKFSETLRENCHVVAHMTADERTSEDAEGVKYVRVLQVYPTKSVVAKTRIGGFATRVKVEEFNEKVAAWLEDGATKTIEITELADDPDDELASSEESDELAGIEVEE